MRLIFGIMSLFISLLLVSACSSIQIKLPEKYNLGDQLEEVTEIQDLRIGGGRKPSFTEFREHEDFDFEPAPDVIARRDTFILSEAQNHWIRVDNQSLILRNGPNEFYLLILQRPAYDLMTVDAISFVNMLNIIRVKKDLVEIGANKYGIERIYKMVGNRKMHTIKNQISGR